MLVFKELGKIIKSNKLSMINIIYKISFDWKEKGDKYNFINHFVSRFITN